MNIGILEQSRYICFDATSRGDISFLSAIVKYINVNYIYEDGTTLLHVASKNGHSEIVQIILNASGNINQADYRGNTALHLSSASGHVVIVSILLNRGAFIYPNNDFNTPLHLASQNGHLAVTKILLSKGAYINEVNEMQKTPLHLASQNGHLEIVALLLNQGSKIFKGDFYGFTAQDLAEQTNHYQVVELIKKRRLEVDKIFNKLFSIHHAVSIGNAKIIAKLLNNGVNINEIDLDNMTPLNYSVLSKKLDIVKFLLFSGALINQANRYGVTALHLSIITNNESIIHFLLNMGANISQMDNNDYAPIHYAALHNLTNIIELLLHRGEKIDQRGISAVTPLHIASKYGNLDSINYLLVKGSGMNLFDQYGKTPLHYAAEHNKSEAFFLLLSKGANFYSIDNNGMNVIHFAATSGATLLIDSLLYYDDTNMINATNLNMESPLHIAIKFGHIDLVQLLLFNNANIEQVDSNGMTPICTAIIFDNLDIINLLIQNGANINYRLNNYITPLYLAIHIGNSDTVALLLSYGTEIDQSINSNNVTCIHLSVLKQKIAILELLIEYGYDVNQCDNNKISPIDLSVLYNYYEITKLLVKKGAEINKIDRKGLSPLEKASINRNTEILSILLEHGANLHMEKAFTYSYSRGNYDVMELLIKNGAEIYDDKEQPVFVELFNTNRVLFNYLYNISLSSKKFYKKSLVDLDKSFMKSIYFDKDLVMSYLNNMMQDVLNLVEIFKLLASDIPILLDIFNANHLLYEMIKFLSLSEIQKIVRDHVEDINFIIEDLEQNGYIIKEVEKDEHSFLRAIAASLNQPENSYTSLKSHIACYIQTYYNNFIKIYKGLDYHIKTIEEGLNYQNDLPLQIVADALNINIEIYNPYLKTINKTNATNETDFTIKLLSRLGHYIGICPDKIDSIEGLELEKDTEYINIVGDISDD
jgi:ankyrin repeat protein